MTRILVTYATLSGTTVDIAQAVASEIANSGVSVEILPIGQVKALDSYDAVVVGAPMIAGWHRAALGFLRKHRNVLRDKPLALFATAMTVTKTETGAVNGVPLCIDDALPKPPARAGHLTFRENYARPDHYVGPMLSAARPARPVSVALFGGRLDYGRLPFWAVVFAMVVVQAPAGNKHNLPFVQQWARGLSQAFMGTPAA